MELPIALAVLATAACSDGSGSSVDVPTTVTVTGTAFDIGLSGRTPLAGVLIAAYEENGTTPVAMTTSAASTGNYTLSITTDGAALEGYLLGTFADRKDTYLYPTGPLTSDIAGATVLMLTPNLFSASFAVAQVSEDPAKGWVGIVVSTAANDPVKGATVSSSPAGTVRYNSDSGLPNSSATATFEDGVGYIFNVGPGDVTISATKAGLTFKSHAVNARAGQVTTTLIQP